MKDIIPKKDGTKMIIVYESKSGFTKKYATMLSEIIGLKSYHTSEISKISKDEEIIFLGWIKIGKIQGLSKFSDYNVKAVCGSGTARRAEPDEETLLKRNSIEDIPFFYLRGGCLPLKKLKGIDKIMMIMFVSMLKKRKDKSEEIIESINTIENGFDGVKEENLLSIIHWFNSKECN